MAPRKVINRLNIQSGNLRAWLLHSLLAGPRLLFEFALVVLFIELIWAIFEMLLIC